MFRGQFKYSIDAKGRVALPAKLRKHVSEEAHESFIMTKGRDACIEIYPSDIWAKDIESKLTQLNPFLKDDSRFLRMMSQDAYDDVLDSQSRLLVPHTLLEHAKINKEVLIIGVLNKIEIWNPAVYEEYTKEATMTFEDLAAKVMA
ncbi:MAG: division/cell wall cluster transcriptional repressor MraZ [Bacteroidota bacterium]|nr:division/cell wall cluster transcriptional repressor MraZ [Bacteroidota bacterium]